jgi:hypothetical protein
MFDKFTRGVQFSLINYRYEAKKARRSQIWQLVTDSITARGPCIQWRLVTGLNYFGFFPRLRPAQSPLFSRRRLLSMLLLCMVPRGVCKSLRWSRFDCPGDLNTHIGDQSTTGSIIPLGTMWRSSRKRRADYASRPPASSSSSVPPIQQPFARTETPASLFPQPYSDRYGGEAGPDSQQWPPFGSIPQRRPSTATPSVEQSDSRNASDTGWNRLPGRPAYYSPMRPLVTGPAGANTLHRRASFSSPPAPIEPALWPPIQPDMRRSGGRAICSIRCVCLFSLNLVIVALLDRSTGRHLHQSDTSPNPALGPSLPPLPGATFRLPPLPPVAPRLPDMFLPIRIRSGKRVLAPPVPCGVSDGGLLDTTNPRRFSISSEHVRTWEDRRSVTSMSRRNSTVEQNDEVIIHHCVLSEFV